MSHMRHMPPSPPPARHHSSSSQARFCGRLSAEPKTRFWSSIENKYCRLKSQYSFDAHKGRGEVMATSSLFQGTQTMYFCSRLDKISSASCLHVYLVITIQLMPTRCEAICKFTPHQGHFDLPVTGAQACNRTACDLPLL